MYFNHKQAWKEYRAEQKRLREAGMPEQDITAIGLLDKEQLRSDRRYYYCVGRYIDSLEALPHPMSADWELDTLDSIDSPVLHLALLELKEDERRIVFLHVVDGLPLKLIAELWGKPYSLIQKQYHRAIEKIKKYF